MMELGATGPSKLPSRMPDKIGREGDFDPQIPFIQKHSESTASRNIQIIHGIIYKFNAYSVFLMLCSNYRVKVFRHYAMLKQKSKCCDNTGLLIMAYQLGLILLGSVSWLNFTYLDSCVHGFFSASPVLISTQLLRRSGMCIKKPVSTINSQFQSIQKPKRRELFRFRVIKQNQETWTAGAGGYSQWSEKAKLDIPLANLIEWFHAISSFECKIPADRQQRIWTKKWEYSSATKGKEWMLERATSRLVDKSLVTENTVTTQHATFLHVDKITSNILQFVTLKHENHAPKIRSEPSKQPPTPMNLTNRWTIWNTKIQFNNIFKTIEKHSE